MPVIIESNVILLKDLDINLAAAGGITKKAAIKTMPTTFIETTTVTEIKTLSR